MSSPVTEAGSYLNFSATTTISLPNVQLLGVFVSSTSGTPTLTISDGASTAISAFTPIHLRRFKYGLRIFLNKYLNLITLKFKNYFHQ